MADYGGFRTTPIHKTKILPLRWFANNVFSPISHKFLNLGLKIYFRDEDGIEPMTPALKRKMKFYIILENLFGKPYYRWGTRYQLDLDALKQAWDEDPEHQELMSRLKDYNEDGIPYWDYYWHEDPVTGDAWRLVDKKEFTVDEVW